MYGMKIFRLVCEILNFTYLVAMFWFIMLKLIEDFYYGVDYSDLDFNDDQIYNKHGDNFITDNDLQYMSPIEITIILCYFAFTSLSTVGFGDFVPRSDLERIVGAFVLLLGVAIFSYIMGIFLDILN